MNRLEAAFFVFILGMDCSSNLISAGGGRLALTYRTLSDLLLSLVLPHCCCSSKVLLLLFLGRHHHDHLATL